MKLKSKYIIGAVIISMFFTMPLSYATDDDVVVFGGEFDDNVEIPSTDVPSTTDDGNEIEQPYVESEIKEDDYININKNSEKINDTYNEDTSIADIPFFTDEVDKTDDNTIFINYNDENIENGVNINNINLDDKSIVDIDETAADDYEIGEIINFGGSATNSDNVYINSYNPKNYDKEENDTKIDNINNRKNESVSDTKTKVKINSGEENATTTNIYSFKNRINKNNTNSDQNQIKKRARFVKLLSDDTYDYYLDRNAVRWINLPYSRSEYMADIWIRMIEKNQDNDENMPKDLYDYVNDRFDDEISDAAAKGIIYDEVDVKVLRTKKYFLEHYYIRPKRQQIQFLCELEVIGRPQNTISERTYDYKNWEGLIPGSIEFSIYHGVLSDIGTSKASPRGHMTVVDMIDEYARIALN